MAFRARGLGSRQTNEQFRRVFASRIVAPGGAPECIEREIERRAGGDTPPIETRGLTQERIAENQSTFRVANERIEAVADDAALAGRVPFICECADASCMEIVRLSLDEYEEVRRHPRRFFNAPGHEAISVDAGAGVVTGHGEGYVLVDKIDVAGEIAEQRYEALGERGPDG